MPYQQPQPKGWPSRVDKGRALAAFVRCSQSAPTTPKHPLSERVEDFCGRLSSSPPVLLQLTETTENYKAGFCHANVLHQVKHHGGHQVYGWMIWEGTNFVEAEFHSVWQSGENSELLDITPRIDGEFEVLFLPDPTTRLTRVGEVDYGIANRTDIPECPYTAARQPYPTPTYPMDYSLDREMIVEMRRLGFSKLSQAIGLDAFD
ncbi:hypothetical protein [Caulobacter soli]|uniref:hypothetical protein n=1 Tax=Caulobacter soli TaxID=2708539 RepID=UPI0013ED8F0E|nr:hypothetical protein [Caulobacter soli]